MEKSLINFQFYKSFRMKVFDKDKIFIKITALDGDLRGQEFEERIHINDINLHSVSFNSPQYFQTNDRVRLTIFNKKFFNKWELDVEGTVVRAFSGNAQGNIINYGVKLDKQEDESELKYFLKDFVHGFSTARLKKYLIQSALSEKTVTADDGVELYSLLASIYNERTDLSLEALLEYIKIYLHAEYSKLYVINTETDKLEAISVSGSSEKDTIDFREGYAGQVFTSGNVLNIVLPEVTKNDKKVRPSLLATPVFNGLNQIVGVIEVANKLNARFNQVDESVLDFLSHIISSHFDNYNPMTKNTAVNQFNPTLKENFLYLGQSKNAIFVRSTFKKLQNTNENIFIVGEKGLGKSFVAKSLHFNGKYALKELKVIDCKEKELLASLFENNFEEINFEEEGTLILKNVEFLTNKEQFNLYHQILHTKKRIISTSLIDIEYRVKNGLFNEQFYNLVNRAYIHLKPLRNRKKDILSISNYFLEVECEKRNLETKKFCDQTRTNLLEYPWPGNTEELERMIKKALMKSSDQDNNFVSLEFPQTKNNHKNKKSEIVDLVKNLEKHTDKSIPFQDNMRLIFEILDRGKKAL